MNDEEWGDPLKEQKVQVEVVKEEEEGKAPKLREAAPAEEDAEDVDKISERVQKRINKLVRQRKERDEAHEAERTRWETERSALLKERDEARKTATSTTSAALTTQEKSLKEKLALAKTAFADAFDSGNKEKLAEAQEAISSATAELKLLEVTRLRMPKEAAEEVEEETPARKPKARPQKQEVSELAQEWASTHKSWFGKDRAKTAFALGIDSDLKDEGFDPDSEEYYSELDNRMKESFPKLYAQDEEEEEEEAPRAKTPKVVRKQAGPRMAGGRGSPTTKVRITEGQEEMRRKLGVDEESYAIQAEAAKNTDSMGYATIPIPTRRR